ncbi:putative secreted protein (Por secretion system target) [Kordia periserrulae]|uniref:Putative secreted protein (Por secretion system target) n=1 Tax=Kordia periserrulae TaxID=701523 RepID=A0A2T6BZP3_9FLAO|nr:T9SS type A sorting domain-containing protein [Kordia periserrulae]PTX61540.1 putative secreted protein (Por secretion system target) [Kordia periserrulae]
MKKITFLCLLLMTSLAFAQPTTNPAAPTNAAVDVISVYGDTYTNIATNYDPNWGQSGHMQVNPNYDPGTGQFLLAYPNFNYQGTEVTTTDASQMEFLHIDIWTSASPGATDIQVSPINNGSGVGETLVSIAYTSGTWTSVDIPKSAFTGMTWDSVFQMKFAANGPGSTVPVDIYLDNVYFWKNPTAPGSDATLSDLQIDGSTISGFGSGVFNYTVGLAPGTTMPPQITSVTTTDPAATTNITQAPAVPGDATVVVTSQNGMVMETYTVSFEISGPATGAPQPPNRPAADVVSIYSDAYPNITVNTYDAGWCGAAITEVQIGGNNTFKKNSGIPCQGIDFSTNRQNLTDFTYIHFDFYTDDVDLTGDVFNVKLVDFAGGGGEASALEVNINTGTTPAIVAGTWVSVDIDITSLGGVVAGSLTRSDIAQIGITTANLTNVWYDNIYLHKNTVLSTEEFNTSSFKTYPNPTNDAWNVVTDDTVINTIAVYDISGRQVLTMEPKATRATIDGTSLQGGIYFASISTDKGTSSVKLVKN